MLVLSMQKINPPILITGIVVALVVAIGALLLTSNNPQSGVQKIQPPPLPSIPPINEIIVTENGFEPTTITVKTNDLVIWKNESGNEATVNSDPHPEHNEFMDLNLGKFPDGFSMQTQFKTPGTYKYHNHLNPEQMGTVIVK